MSKKTLVYMIILFILLPVVVYSENQENIPEEYEEDEFPGFLKDLRRAEIIFFGSLPISLFFTFEVYDISRWLYHDRQAAYSPWPFRSYEYIPYSEGDTWRILISALSVSFLVALTDFIIGRIKRDAELE